MILPNILLNIQKLLIDQRPSVFLFVIDQPHINLMLQDRYGTAKLNGRHPGIHFFFLGMYLNLADCPYLSVLILNFQHGRHHFPMICKPTMAGYFLLFPFDRTSICSIRICPDAKCHVTPPSLNLLSFCCNPPSVFLMPMYFLALICPR